MFNVKYILNTGLFYPTSIIELCLKYNDLDPVCVLSLVVWSKGLGSGLVGSVRDQIFVRLNFYFILQYSSSTSFN